MFKGVRRSAVHGVCAAAALALSPVTATTQAEPDRAGAQAFPALPLPPAIEELVGMPQTYTPARSSYLALITSEAEQRGLPAALADAVAQVESRYDPKAVGSLGEVGLMQIRAPTAALLGYKGEAAGLAEPETNVRLGVAYLARAWQLANGDVCRALMKYRAGWGEERMTPFSVEYCRRARVHLAAIGSPLADEARPTPQEPATVVVAQPNQKLSPASSPGAARLQSAAPQLAAAKQTPVEPVPLPPIRLASLGATAPAGDVGQTRSEAPKSNGAATDKNAARQRASAPRVTPPPIGPSKAQPQPPRVSMAKAEPVKSAEPRTGTLPNVQHRGGEAASEQNLRRGPAKAPPIASAAPNQARAEPDVRSPSREVTPPAPLRSLPTLSASSGGVVERATAPNPRSPAGTPAPALPLRPGLTGRTQTAALAQPEAAAAEAEVARKRMEARLQAQEKRLRMTLKSICTGC
jgi:Transglycosylase SLT domain